MINSLEIDDYNHLFELLPEECIDECSGSGDNGPACEYWVDKLSLNIPRQQCIDELKSFGAWTKEELNKESDKELNERFLWIAAGCEVINEEDY